ncbi:MAG TPA: hypothetical protein VIT21_11945 [Chthoniobacterales bacterium]
MKSDPLSKLEAELAELQPCASSEALRCRISAQLRHQAVTSHVRLKKSAAYRLNWFAWGWGLVAVMSVALVTSVWPGAGENETPSSRIIHYQILSERDDGVVFDETGRPVRQVRYAADETVRWRSPRTGASIQMSYPREETMLIPVSGN